MREQGNVGERKKEKRKKVTQLLSSILLYRKQTENSTPLIHTCAPEDWYAVLRMAGFGLRRPTPTIPYHMERSHT